jgi:hypothetical protein
VLVWPRRDSAVATDLATKATDEKGARLGGHLFIAPRAKRYVS